MITELESTLLQHCINMNIIKKDAPQKKIDSILDSLIAAIIRSETNIQTLNECIQDINNDNIINIDFFNKGGNLTDYINPKYINLAQALYRQRCVGIGTPNAASGEGELMFLFLSKSITKPTKGDLKINKDIIELKGESVRITGKVSGTEFRKRTLDICTFYNLTPNKANITSKELFAVELEKPQHLTHWTNELNKLNLNDQKCFVIDWLKCLNTKFDDFKVINRIFENDTFNHNLFLKEIVKILYVDMLEDGQFNLLVLLGDGKNCKIIKGNSVTDFNKKVDDNTIEIESDYFRINQTFPVGMYIK